jgi:hypothetical protein
MKLTGTLIESLMATVERSEQKAPAQSSRALAIERLAMEPLVIDSWFASAQENINKEYDSQLFGVA